MRQNLPPILSAPLMAILNWFEPGGKQRLLPMEGIRGFAVLLVFFVHFAGAVAVGGLKIDVEHIAFQDAPGVWRKLITWLHFSHHGVHLFFLLSGFLICRMVIARDQFDYGRFLWRRVLRIYPAFLASLGLCVAWLVLGHAPEPIDGSTLLANLFFLNGLPQLGIRGYNHVTWSLFMEFVFYLVFPLLLLFRSRGMFREKWMVVAAGFVLVYGSRITGYVDAAYLLFFSGAFLAQFRDEDLRRFAAGLPDAFVLGAFLFVTTGRAMRWFDYQSFILLFLVAGALLVVQACYGQGFLRRIFEWAPLRFLGNISYSFYLLHSLVLSAVAVSVWHGDLGAFSHRGASLAFFALSFIASLALASLSFLLFERPYFARHAANRSG